jgi:hypothetical protein
VSDAAGAAQGDGPLREETQFDPDAVIDAMAPLLDLTIGQDFRAGVATSLRICADFAAVVASVPLDDHEEPAPVFVA